MKPNSIDSVCGTDLEVIVLIIDMVYMIGLKSVDVNGLWIGDGHVVRWICDAVSV